MNDLVRDKLTDKNGNITPYAEVMAGCCVSIYSNEKYLSKLFRTKKTLFPTFTYSYTYFLY